MVFSKSRKKKNKKETIPWIGLIGGVNIKKIVGKFRIKNGVTN